MHTVTISEASRNLPELIDAAASGEEVVIRKDDQTAVQLVPRPVRERKRQFGSARGLITMAPDFDEPLPDFAEYAE